MIWGYRNYSVLLPAVITNDYTLMAQMYRIMRRKSNQVVIDEVKIPTETLCVWGVYYENKGQYNHNG